MVAADRAPIDYARTAALQLVAEVLEEGCRRAPEDAVFRLALAVMEEMQVGRVWMPVTYFALWMSRLMGWMPELGHCVAVRTGPARRAGVVVGCRDGVTCADDRRGGSAVLSAASVAEAQRFFRTPVEELAKEEWPRARAADLRSFAVETAGEASGETDPERAGAGAGLGDAFLTMQWGGEWTAANLQAVG